VEINQKYPEPMLKIIYIERLTEMLASEKKYSLCFEKLSGAAFTDELHTGLSPASFDQQLHVQRLIHCLDLQKVKKAGKITALDQYFLEYGKRVIKGKVPSLQKDLILLHAAQQIFMQKIQGYTSLHQMAIALGAEQSALLLEQCFKDEQNAYNYLVQISQNIIYPNSAIESADKTNR